jgi:Protein of unknown function (DUF1393).
MVPKIRVETKFTPVATKPCKNTLVAGSLKSKISPSDAISYGSVWWSWVIADAVFALIFGIAIKRLQLTNGDFSTRKVVLFNVWQLVANVIAWSIVASFSECPMKATKAPTIGPNMAVIKVSQA